MTFEMLRAFVTLSESLNLTEASHRLGVTRQTIRRYITCLEELKGAPLFTLERNTYALTPLGGAMIDDAKVILRQTERWRVPVEGRGQMVPRLETSQCVDRQGREFLSQQHPICDISHKGSPLIQDALAAWATSSARLEATAFAAVRPYVVVYKKDPLGWLCIEIGELSAYTQWFGWTWSKSAVGNLSRNDQAGDEFDRMVSETYATVHRSGDARLDHVFAHLPRETSEQPLPVTFQRLLMTLILPDRSPVLAVLVVITRHVEINALMQDDAPAIPEDLEAIP